MRTLNILTICISLALLCSCSRGMVDALESQQKTLLRVEVSPSSKTLPANVVQVFQGYAFYSDGSSENITSHGTWASSDNTIASLQSSSTDYAQVMTNSSGSTTVYLTYKGMSSQSTLTVTAATLASITVNAPVASAAKGLTKQYTATGIYSDASTADLTYTVNWGSTNSSVATISNTVGTQGIMTGLAVGSTNITATYSSISGNVALSITPAELVSVYITPGSTNIVHGLFQQFRAYAVYTDSSVVEVTSSASWSTSNSLLAAINVLGTDGLASILAVGIVNIYATYGGKTGQSTITIL